jgi:uncharacterized protein (DUF1501 family)
MPPRRVFLKSSGLALVSFGLAPRALLRAAEAAEAGSRGKVLVVVFQRGACDGLNSVVPYAESAYRSLRPGIAIPPPRGTARDAALDLDGFFGLHPALEPLLPLWREGSLAVVQAVGSPDATRSHFDAQDFMESGTPGRGATEEGWMNRALQSQPQADSTPFRAVSLTPTLPRSLAGRAPALALASIGGFGLQAPAGGALARGFEAMYRAHDALHGASREAFQAIESLRKTRPARLAPPADAIYPSGRFGESLKQVAQLIQAGLGVELAFVEIGGWDHHAGEGGVRGQLAARLRELGRGLAAFRRHLGPRLQDVALVTLTEFGRTAKENGNRGTDHGHASVAFVMGGSALRGGRVHGRWPGLSRDRLHEGRDLALTTDFRDLLGELLVRHLGLRDLRKVFPGHDTAASRFPGVMA